MRSFNLLALPLIQRLDNPADQALLPPWASLDNHSYIEVLNLSCSRGTKPGSFCPETL